jgi:omega-6 fatty acid desaturase (delta-12 desaturase)
MSRSALYEELAPFQKPDRRKAVWQLVNTLVPYVGLWVAMVILIHQGTSYWLVLPLILAASALLVRIFIFFHDCCHGSFFASRRANRILGIVTGILTFTAYDDWRHSHARHHATAGDLDRRGEGDVWTMTVEEYRNAPPLKRLFYRFYRTPVVTFGLGPAYMFLLTHRFASKGAETRERVSVIVTNLAIAAIIAAAGLTIGLRTYVLIQLPVILIAGSLGVWLFYVQHQFEGVYWARHESWDMMRAAMEGSSYYKLPKVLQWITGNIGFHHVHHVLPRIPNYNLPASYEAVPYLQTVEPVTLRESLKSLRMRLYDEERKQMVGFRSPGL